MKEFTSALLGGQTPSLFFALMFFALLGALLSLLLQTTNRDVYSNSTPRHFSWVFFITDNWKRALTGLLLIYVSLRFAPELFGWQISNFWAIVIGLGNDKIAQVIKDKTNLLGQKK
jgi:hypothetical protein